MRRIRFFVLERKLGAAVVCVGEICFARDCGLCRRGWVWRVSVVCGGEGWGWGEALVKLRKAAVRQESA